MSSPNPSDLAVAFRSLARRRNEAIDAAEGAAVDDLAGALDSAIADAAAAVGAGADGESIAAAIDSKSPDDWDDATLNRLSDAALRAGASLRDIAARGPSD